MGSLLCLLSVIILTLCYCVDAACSNGKCKVCMPYHLLHMNHAFNFSVLKLYLFPMFYQLNDECSSNGDCGPGLYCFSCPLGFSGSRCVRSSVTDQFKLIVRFQFFVCICLISQETVTTQA